MPIFHDDEIVGTMDFFATRTLVLSEERLLALTGIAELISQNISRIRAAEHAKDLFEIEESLGDLQRRLAEVSNIKQALMAGIGLVSEVMGFDFGGLWLENPDHNVLEVYEVTASVSREFDIMADQITIKPHQGGLGNAWANSTIDFVDDLSTLSGDARSRAAAEAGMKQAVFIRVTHSDRVIGAVELYAKRPIVMDEKNKTFFDRVDTLMIESMSRIQENTNTTRLATIANTGTALQDYLARTHDDEAG